MEEWEGREWCVGFRLDQTGGWMLLENWELFRGITLMSRNLGALCLKEKQLLFFPTLINLGGWAPPLRIYKLSESRMFYVFLA